MDKASIVQEIKRTAAANGGVPLGWRRFRSVTAIRESDWFGVYWARWSDAVREAGLAPNLPTQPYPALELLDRYARLALELGRLPAHGDLMLQARRQRGFPSERTFARLGTKAELVKQLLEHCRARDGYEEVARWCAAYAPPDGGGPGESASAGEARLGYVYLLKSGRFHKIGKSNAPPRRARELAVQLPERARLIHVIRTDDPSGIEAYWHRRFRAKRKNGEWFALSAADVAVFKRRKFM
jgi:hypothetical protein